MIDKAEHQTENQTADGGVDSLAAEQAVSSSQLSATGRFALFVAMLALFFTAAGIGVGYRHWQRMNDKNRINQQEISQLRQQMARTADKGVIDSLRKTMDGKLDQASTSNSDVIKEMTRMQNQTRQFADTVASQVEQVTYLQARMQQAATPASTKEWQVEEVRFLLQLANRALYLEHNTGMAKAALKEADTELASIGVVAYLPVRQQITRDIAALDEANLPDIAGISQRITSMMLALKPLPAVQDGGVAGYSSGDVAASQKNWAGQATSGNSLWADYKREMLDTISKAVVIHKLDQPLQQGLGADSRQMLYHLLHLRLETLRLLLLRQDDAGFHEQIGLIKDTLNAYYPEQQAKPLLEELQSLQKLDLQPVMPDISGSLKQLESARQTEKSTVPEPKADTADEDKKPKDKNKDKHEGDKHE